MLEAGKDSILPEEYFHRTICLERKRAERSGKPFLLMLLDIGNAFPNEKSGKVMQSVLSALALSTRDTDVAGWYKQHQVVGIMFTEIAPDLKKSILATILMRVSGSLKDCLTLEQFSQIGITFHLFPEDWEEHSTPQDPNESVMYPDLQQEVVNKRWSRMLKRAMDIAGSLFAVILFSPVFLAIAIAVKLGSKGPIFFKQQRVGEYGARFTFLKFRSMYVNNSAEKHKEYVKKLIAGQAEKKEGGTFKLTDDPRITPVGKWIRRTSLDELPQFFNVLLRRYVTGRARVLRYLMKSKHTTCGTAAVCWKRVRELPDSGRSTDAAAPSLTRWFGWTCSMPANNRCCLM